jgi:uncharacterized protein YkwD
VSFKHLFAGGSAALILVTVFSTTPANAFRTSCWDPKTSELAFVRKMNRARPGWRGLRLDPQLSRVARTHTRAMARRELLFHSSGLQLRRRVTNWTLLGENVGYGATVSSLHRAFMASPPHRANVQRGEFRNVGVGVRRQQGRLWVTVIFQSRANPGTTMSMPSC